MAIGDSYADPGDYRSKVDKTASGDDADLAFQLNAVSRFIDQRCRRTFNKTTAAEARIYSGNGKPKIWLEHDIATTAGLTVKCDLNGDYDVSDSGETLTINTHFWPGPYNAALGSEAKPFEWLELRPGNAAVTIWPCQPRAIEVTAVFGWPAVPSAIKELTIALTRYLRDLQESGMGTMINAIETAVSIDSPAARQATSLLRQIEHMYARPPSF